MHKKCKAMRDESRGNRFFFFFSSIYCVHCKQVNEEQGLSRNISDLDETAQAKLEASSSVWRSMKLLRGIQSLVDGTLNLGGRTEDGDVTRKESFERRREADLGASKKE